MSIQRAPQASPPQHQHPAPPSGGADFGQTVVLPGNSQPVTATPLDATQMAGGATSPSSVMRASAALAAAVDAAATPNRYQTVRQIGEGGMGEVVLSRDPTIGRQVAVKRMKRLPEQSPGATERFMTEVQTTGKLEHPGIVPIYDAGFDGEGNPYFVMKYVTAQKNAARSRSCEGDYLPASGDLHHARRAPTSSPGITLGSDRSSGGPRWET